MRKIFAIIAAILFSAIVWAQSPEKMSYQAVIRNNNDALVTNTQVRIQVSILQGSATGTAVYMENQSPTTNGNGLVNIEVGDGTVVSGNFKSINWAYGPYFIKTEIDPNGGTNYTITGTSQLLSVPFALHAKTAETVTGGSSSHYVGEYYGGGVVFWVDHSGQHGLIVNMVNLGETPQEWSNVSSIQNRTTSPK